MPFALPVLFFSCSKTLQQRELSFSVVSLNSARQPATTFNLGDTTFFDFTGNPDHITFFSGLPGSRYQYAGRSVDSTSAIDTLRFSTALNAIGAGSLQLLISNTLPGSFTYTQMNSKDSAAILANASAWTDISTRATWATNATVKVSSVGLNDYATAGKLVWLAFRYTAPAGSAQAKWTIGAAPPSASTPSLGLRHYTADTSYCIDSTSLTIPSSYPAWVTSPGWGVVSIDSPQVKFVLNNPYTGPNGVNSALYNNSSSSPTTTSFTVTGATTAATAKPIEAWIVSGPINLYQVLPDVGLEVKDMTTNAATTLYNGAGGLLNTWANFSIKFARRGTFNVVFVGYTDTKDKSSQVVKSMTIIVQ